ncbi:MAG: hypothetical protein HUU20_27310 [Pirellulales bacterium]|nr:hypothetical protein [Pirellulales bacterium]
MIAPIRESEPEAAERRQRLRLAHQGVFSTLLDPRPAPKTDSPTVPRWQAWLLAGWMVSVVALYFASMLGWW